MLTTRFLPLVFFATSALAAPRREKPPADDKEPPSIVHAPLREAQFNNELRFEAEIYDASGVFEPLVSWRRAGQASWQTLKLEKVAGDRFLAALPSYQVQGDLEYFIEAYDTQGNGPARFANPERPVRVRVVGAPQASPAAPPVAAPALQPAAAPASAVAPAAPSAPPSPAPAPVLAPAPESGAFPIGPAITLGVGALAAAAGAILWFGASADAEELNRRYATGASLSVEDHNLAAAASGRGRIGSILMIAGGAVALGGAGWLFFAPGLGLALRENF